MAGHGAVPAQVQGEVEHCCPHGARAVSTFIRRLKRAAAGSCTGNFALYAGAVMFPSLLWSPRQEAASAASGVSLVSFARPQISEILTVS